VPIPPIYGAAQAPEALGPANCAAICLWTSGQRKVLKRYGTDCSSDHIAGYDQFYAAVLLASFCSVIGRNGLGLAETLRGH